MNGRRLTQVLLCMIISYIPLDEPSANEAKNITTVDYSSVVARLPWKFRQRQAVMNQVSGTTKQSILHNFVSIKPIKETAQGPVYLNVDLTILSFASREAAEEHLQQIQREAHPDMGLSYEWDYLFRQEMLLYHLHTNCLVSEINFGIMESNLGTIVALAGGSVSEVVQCRCGGGCRVLTNEQH